MSFKVRTTLDTGVSDDAAGWDEEDSPNGAYHEVSFKTKAEAVAYMMGIDVANEATCGWTEGSLCAELVEE